MCARKYWNTVLLYAVPLNTVCNEEGKNMALDNTWRWAERLVRRALVKSDKAGTGSPLLLGRK
jgi:hypothetical protein